MAPDSTLDITEWWVSRFKTDPSFTFLAMFNHHLEKDQDGESYEEPVLNCVRMVMGGDCRVDFYDDLLLEILGPTLKRELEDRQCQSLRETWTESDILQNYR